MTAKNRGRRAPAERGQSGVSWLIFLVAGAMLLSAAGFVVLRNTGRPAEVLLESPASGASGPWLAIDQTEQDLGEFRFDQPAHSEFVLRNVGDQPVRILDQPRVVALKGC